MTPVIRSSAVAFQPASPETALAADNFISKVSDWGLRFHAAKDELKAFVQQNVNASVRGFVSKDPLNMSVFGLIFDKAPDQGFLAVPNDIATDLRAQGLRGDAYFPDPETDLGKQVLKLMSKVSRLAEQRPLLQAPGIAPVVIEDNRLVISRAMVTDDGVVLKAAASAVSADAKVTRVLEVAAAATQQASQRTAQTSRMSM
ncbi:hypothetical protein [Paucibacter soli]|uniref:hypothetical protein n=1 Tax=Paucibacter soli TaxID=3133433 RepID=UPI0030B2B262